MSLIVVLFSLLLLIVGISIITAASAYELLFKKKDFDFFTLFLMGVTWLIVSIFVKRIFFLILGIIVTIFSIKHKENWTKNYKHWQNYNKQEKLLKAIVMSGLFILAVLSVAVYFVTILFLA